MKENSLQAVATKDLEEMQNGEGLVEDQDFKVFRDPTFNEFVQIVGSKYNQDLPLFAQLYILKEIL